MATRPVLPLYLLVTGLSILLVLVIGGSVRWLAQGEPTIWVFVAQVALAGVFSLLLARWLTGPLRRLAEEAEAIRRFDFTDRPVIRSSVSEVHQLAKSVDLLRDAVRQFIDLNLAIAGEDDFEQLLPRVLAEMAAAGAADAGALYLVNARGDALVAGALYRDGASTGRPSVPEVRLDAAPALMAGALRASRAAVGAFDAAELAGCGFDPAFAGQAAAAVPLLNRHEQLVGMLVLSGDRTLDPARLRFVEAVSAAAALSLETRELVRGQKELFEAMIRMVAGAIDAQSPYTGGHCERVPELTFMLARAACETREGPFADFALDAREWEAVHIASWLHDCGKVTTPEFVVDKATKLETICDRIHEVRMRFEVLKRDADIDFWRGLAQGGGEAALRRARDARWAALDEEFAFVARCNVGGEFLAPEHQERLRRIGARTWLRTLDDRLGLSRDELSRRTHAPPPLPMEEPLLADKPEHRIARPEGEGTPPTDNPWGFRMDVPELMYNRGELHNLTVSRGTLSAEERYKINEHIVQTIVMLSQLPFPRHLQAVPEIAGGHHEKMDGTGYPRGLTREQMSPVARMMAIADIFEALTAADRPYKPGKSLSQALSIMAKMRAEQHIDPDLFELFLRSGVYREYAQTFMRAEQIDEVSIEDYLERSASATV